MTYTQIALAAAIGAVIFDLFILRTRVLKLGVWWVSYAIVIGFQFITNGTLTGFAIVQYSPDAVIGKKLYEQTPPFIGDGRLFFAPVEDVFFGFAMCLSAVVFWVYFGSKGIQRVPVSNTSVGMRERFKFLK